MGCGHSKEELETGHIHDKTKRKTKKSKDLKSKTTQLIQQKEEAPKNDNTHLEKHEKNEKLNGKVSIEGLICDGISGKTEFFPPKKSNEKGNGDEGFIEDKEKVFLNEENARELSIDEVICDGVSGKTEYYSPKRANEGDKKEDIDDNGNGNAVEGVICDGCSGKTEYYSTKESRDDVEVEDKEVLVEEKTGEAKKTGETEDKINNEFLDKTKFSSIEKTNIDVVDEKDFPSIEKTNIDVVDEKDFPSIEKTNIDDVDEKDFTFIEKTNIDVVDEKDFPAKEKESETETTVHVSGFVFDHLLSWWKTREV